MEEARASSPQREHDTVQCPCRVPHGQMTGTVPELSKTLAGNPIKGKDNSAKLELKLLEGGGHSPMIGEKIAALVNVGIGYPR